MVEYSHDFVNVDGVKLHYYRAGAGDNTIILLHGATDNGVCWSPVARLLAEKYDVVMPDAQGHGLSDRLESGFTFMDHAHQVAGLAQALEIKQPVIIGHSMGASTAVNVAAYYPDLPKAIILEDPGWGSIKAGEADAHNQSDSFAGIFVELSRRTREELISQCRKDNPRWPEGDIIPWAEAKLQFDTRLFSLMQIDNPSYVVQVPKIKCPGLLITSDGGIVTDEIARNAISLWKAQPPLLWVKITNAGHNIRREQFEAFYDALLRFLKSV